MSLQDKYLAVPSVVERSEPKKVHTADCSSQLIPGVYFNAKTAEIEHSQGLIVKTYTGKNGEVWRLLTRESLAWVEQSVQSALGKPRVDDGELSRAILFFYRLRECWETDGASEGIKVGGW